MESPDIREVTLLSVYPNGIPLSDYGKVVNLIASQSIWLLGNDG